MKVGNLTRKLMVEAYKRKIKDANCIVFTNFKGLKADTVREIRAKLSASSCNMIIVKNSIFKRALNELNLDCLVNYVDGELAVVYGRDDPIAIAKQIQELGKIFEALKIKAGLVEGEVLEQPQLLKIANLSSKNMLYAQIATYLKGIILELVFTLKGEILALLNVLNQIKNKK